MIEFIVVLGIIISKTILFFIVNFHCKNNNYNKQESLFIYIKINYLIFILFKKIALSLRIFYVFNNLDLIIVVLHMHHYLLGTY